MVALVDDSITKEEFRGEPSQKFLIIDRCPFGILLSLEIPFDFVKPGYVCHFFDVDLTAVYGFVQPLDGDPGSFIVPPDFEHRRHSVIRWEN